MWNYFYDAYHSFSRWLTRFDQSEWFLILIVTLVLGFMLLRGSGSRAKY